MHSHNESWRESVPELLSDIADVAAETLREVGGMDADHADYLGYHIMRSIAENVGGMQVYIPKADAIARCERDEAIWREFNGKNTRELARKYSVSQMQIYRVAKRMRALERAKSREAGKM